MAAETAIPAPRPRPTGGKGLTRWSKKKEAFVGAIMEGLNGAEAAVRAGYAPKCAKNTAYALLHRDRWVVAEIDRRKEAMRRMNAVTVDSLIGDFERLEGEAIRQNQMIAAVKAREAIGRMCGLLDQRGGVNINVSGDVVMSHDEALAQALNKSREQIARIREMTPA
ncbi:MAG: terminase small subunit [Rhodospirillales bacterium]|nr:terminase small subunit [Rhodospirillales bacterium]